MIYIFGDSFSAHAGGWPGIINSQTTGSRGSSEYRILRSYKEHQHHIKPNDQVIFCHTNWSRVYLRDNNRSLTSRLLDTHPMCDILFKDVYEKKEKRFIKLLEEIWDEDYFRYVYSTIIAECKQVPNSIHVTFFKEMAKQYDLIDLSDFHKTNPGTVNHMDQHGNSQVAEYILKCI